MSLKTLSKETLLSETDRLVAEERRITTSILWHLFEIERRRLFAELGFASLFDYATQHLKYSAGSAQRRIAAMRLFRELPEIGEKIDSGVLNVSALSQAQSLFRQAKLESKPLDAGQKKMWIERLENKSHRECEQILAEVYPAQAKPSSEKVIAPSRTEIRFEADDALYEKLKLLKARFAHKLKGSQDYKDLISLLADTALEKTEAKMAVKQKTVPALEVRTKKNQCFPLYPSPHSTPSVGKSPRPVQLRASHNSKTLRLEICAGIRPRNPPSTWW